MKNSDQTNLNNTDEVLSKLRKTPLAEDISPGVNIENKLTKDKTFGMDIHRLLISQL